MRIVKVKFLNTIDKDYAECFYYKDGLSRKLQKYDAVIVPTRYGASLAVVEEVGIKEETASRLFNTSAIKSVNEKVKSDTVEALTIIEKRKDLKAQLDKKMKEVDDTQKYKMYAELDPTIADLLKELEGLKT